MFQKSGIFILNKYELLKEDFETIKFKANIVLNAKNGSISNYIKECEDIDKKDKIVKVDIIFKTIYNFFYYIHIFYTIYFY